MQIMKPPNVKAILLMLTLDHPNDSVIACCDSLLTGHRQVLCFLESDGKWILCQKVICRCQGICQGNRSTQHPRNELHIQR